MDPLERVLERWDAREPNSLKELKLQIQKQFKQLTSLLEVAQQKLELIQQLPDEAVTGHLLQLNASVKSTLSLLFKLDDAEDQLVVRRLLKEAITLEDSSKKPLLVNILNKLHKKLFEIEACIRPLFGMIQRQIDILNTPFSYDVRSNLEYETGQEFGLLLSILGKLKELDDSISEEFFKLLGYASKYICPVSNCHKNYVLHDAVRITEGSSQVMHTFHCLFCGHIENANEQTIVQIGAQWNFN